MLSNLPNLVCLAPACQEEYLAMLDWAIDQREHPVLIRVPGAGVASRPELLPSPCADIDWSAPRYQVVRAGERVAILGLGDFLPYAESLADAVRAELGFAPTVINPRIASDVDRAALARLVSSHQVLVTLEDGIVEGGWGQQVVAAAARSGLRMKCYGISKAAGFPDRYDPEDLLAQHGMAIPQIVADLQDLLQG